jgi:V/A-type H+-transporting ATPase subunit E
MSEELQSLLEKINSDGVMKANAQRAPIIAKAEADAEAIVAEARKKAEELKKEAEVEAETLQKRAESAINQAARDVVLKLKAELESRISAAVAGAAEETMTPAFMAELVKSLGASFLADPDADVTVIASVKDAAALDAALKGALVSSLKKQPRVLAESTIRGGMEVNFTGSELYFDFSTEALTGLLAEYTAPKIAAIFAGEK